MRRLIPRRAPLHGQGSARQVGEVSWMLASRNCEVVTTNRREMFVGRAGLHRERIVPTLNSRSSSMVRKGADLREWERCRTCFDGITMSSFSSSPAFKSNSFPLKPCRRVAGKGEEISEMSIKQLGCAREKNRPGERTDPSPSSCSSPNSSPTDPVQDDRIALLIRDLTSTLCGTKEQKGSLSRSARLRATWRRRCASKTCSSRP